MAHKQVVFRSSAREMGLAGATQLADAVHVTLGPRSKSVLIERMWAAPLVCNDGVTIAKEFDLKDSEENLGTRMLRQAAEMAGDGTSTATILAHAIFADGVRNVVAVASATDLKRGLDRETEQVATSSARNDPNVGKLGADGMDSRLRLNVKPSRLPNFRRSSACLRWPPAAVELMPTTSPRSPRIMQTDHKLQLTVLEHLDCDPSVTSSHIGVTVREGIIVLTGHVPNFGEKRAAEAAAGLVQGVKAVVNEIAVDWPGKSQTPDEVIAERVHVRLSTNRSVPIDRIHVVVEDGVVAVRGDVDWHYQREAVENDLHPLECIRGLRNEIKIKPPVKVAAVRKRVRDALSSISPLDAAQVVVKTKGSCVQLSGSVNSWHEKGIAESVARSVPGVSQVENHIIVP